jgi:hypothetical protein
MMMAATTSANASGRLQKVLTDKRMAARDRLKDRLKQGITEGDVPAGTDAAALADFYSTIMTGMALRARDGASRKSLLATVAQAMSIFPGAPRGAAKKKKREPATA